MCSTPYSLAGDISSYLLVALPACDSYAITYMHRHALLQSYEYHPPSSIQDCSNLCHHQYCGTIPQSYPTYGTVGLLTTKGIYTPLHYSNYYSRFLCNHIGYCVDHTTLQGNTAPLCAGSLRNECTGVHELQQLAMYHGLSTAVVSHSWPQDMRLGGTGTTLQ